MLSDEELEYTRRIALGTGSKHTLELLDEIARLRAENAALQAHLPSESVIYCIRSIMDADGVRYGHETYLDEIESWLSDVEPFIADLNRAYTEEE